MLFRLVMVMTMIYEITFYEEGICELLKFMLFFSSFTFYIHSSGIMNELHLRRLHTMCVCKCVSVCRLITAAKGICICVRQVGVLTINIKDKCDLQDQDQAGEFE